MQIIQYDTKVTIVVTESTWWLHLAYPGTCPWLRSFMKHAKHPMSSSS